MLTSHPASSLGKKFSAGLGFAQCLLSPWNRRGGLVVREGQRVHRGSNNLGFSTERLGPRIGFLVSKY